CFARDLSGHSARDFPVRSNCCLCGTGSHGQAQSIRISARANNSQPDHPRHIPHLASEIVLRVRTSTSSAFAPTSECGLRKQEPRNVLSKVRTDPNCFPNPLPSRL